MNIIEAKEHAKKHGWSSKLGYSKKELGIKTPRNPENANHKRRKARTGSNGVKKVFFKLLKKITRKASHGN
jgi:hypothetical protein